MTDPDDPDDKTLISPATTPGSVENGECRHVNYYVPQVVEKNETWYTNLRPPTVAICASVLQIGFFFAVDSVQTSLRFDPLHQNEIWRFCTYMLVHDSWQHLTLNVVLQCFFAVFLESTQIWWRVLVVYMAGGIGGVLGAVCVRPELLVGSSAGVYALLTSYLSYILLNLRGMKYRIWKSFSVALIITSDVLYNVFHSFVHHPSIISWPAHVFGAVAGFLIGLMLYSSNLKSRTIRRTLSYSSGVLLGSTFLTLELINLQLKGCAFLFKHAVYCKLDYQTGVDGRYKSE